VSGSDMYMVAGIGPWPAMGNTQRSVGLTRGGGPSRVPVPGEGGGVDGRRDGRTWTEIVGEDAPRRGTREAQHREALGDGKNVGGNLHKRPPAHRDPSTPPLGRKGISGNAILGSSRNRTGRSGNAKLGSSSNRTGRSGNAKLGSSRNRTGRSGNAKLGSSSNRPDTPTLDHEKEERDREKRTIKSIRDARATQTRVGKEGKLGEGSKLIYKSTSVGDGVVVIWGLGRYTDQVARSRIEAAIGNDLQWEMTAMGNDRGTKHATRHHVKIIGSRGEFRKALERLMAASVLAGWVASPWKSFNMRMRMRLQDIMTTVKRGVESADAYRSRALMAARVEWREAKEKSACPLQKTGMY
jgi:hypothetical protein